MYRFHVDADRVNELKSCTLIPDPDSHAVASYCRTSGPDGVVSATDGHLYLSFTTDGTSTHDGFRLSYKQIADGIFSDVAKT